MKIPQLFEVIMTRSMPLTEVIPFSLNVIDFLPLWMGTRLRRGLPNGIRRCRYTGYGKCSWML